MMPRDLPEAEWSAQFPVQSMQLPNGRFHSLRHTAKSGSSKPGEDPLAIASSFGHADTRMMSERNG
jgi:hypothetical protein